MGQIPYNRRAAAMGSPSYKMKPTMEPAGGGFGPGAWLIVLTCVILGSLLLGSLNSGRGPDAGALPVPTTGSEMVSPSAPPDNGATGATSAAETPDLSDYAEAQNRAAASDRPASGRDGGSAVSGRSEPPSEGERATFAREEPRPRHARRRHRNRRAAEPAWTQLPPERCGIRTQEPDPGWREADTDTDRMERPAGRTRRTVLVVVGSPDGPARRILVRPPGPGYLAPPPPVPYGFPNDGGTGCGGG